MCLTLGQMASADLLLHTHRSMHARTHVIS